MINCRIQAEFVDKEKGNRYFPGEFKVFDAERAKALQDKGLVVAMGGFQLVHGEEDAPDDSWIEKGKKSDVGATLAGMSKREIEAYMLEYHNVNLDRRQSKAHMIEHALDKIFC